MRMRGKTSLALLAVAAILLVAAQTGAQTTKPAAKAGHAAASPALIERGKYLAQAGDCIACHTVPGKPIFSGNRPLPTPFGTLYSPNITPDRKHGIGAW